VVEKVQLIKGVAIEKVDKEKEGRGCGITMEEQRQLVKQLRETGKSTARAWKKKERVGQ
jgi:hypothetical protein